MCNYEFVQLNDLEQIHCPCGISQRGFIDDPDRTASVHYVSISEDARPHYHMSITEIYVILEGTGFIELDGQKIPVKPLSAIKILPGCRHRAIGNLKLLNISIPTFDPEDEWFD